MNGHKCVMMKVGIGRMFYLYLKNMRIILKVKINGMVKKENGKLIKSDIIGKCLIHFSKLQINMVYHLYKILIEVRILVWDMPKSTKKEGLDGILLEVLSNLF